MDRILFRFVHMPVAIGDAAWQGMSLFLFTVTHLCLLGSILLLLTAQHFCMSFWCENIFSNLSYGATAAFSLLSTMPSFAFKKKTCFSK